MLFDNIFNQIILQEQLNILYNNKDIAIIPGKFQIPTKDDWNLIMQYNKLSVDKIIIIISNVSKEKIINRYLSKTNLTKFSNILQNIQKNTTINIKNIKQQLLTKIDNLSYKQLLYYCNKIIPLLNNNIDIKNDLLLYLQNLKKILFKNIKLNIQPKISKQIFYIYANAYNIFNKLDIIISQQQTPYNDMINLILNQCKNCNIYLNLNLQQDNSLFDKLYKDMKSTKNYNNLIPHKVENNRKYINNINNIQRIDFPNKLTNNDISKIKGLIHNEHR